MNFRVQNGGVLSVYDSSPDHAELTHAVLKEGPYCIIVTPLSQGIEAVPTCRWFEFGNFACMQL